MTFFSIPFYKILSVTYSRAVTAPTFYPHTLHKFLECSWPINQVQEIKLSPCQNEKIFVFVYAVHDHVHTPARFMYRGQFMATSRCGVFHDKLPAVAVLMFCCRLNHFGSFPFVEICPLFILAGRNFHKILCILVCHVLSSDKFCIHFFHNTQIVLWHQIFSILCMCFHI